MKHCVDCRTEIPRGRFVRCVSCWYFMGLESFERFPISTVEREKFFLGDLDPFNYWDDQIELLTLKYPDKTVLRLTCPCGHLWRNHTVIGEYKLGVVTCDDCDCKGTD